MQPRIGRHQFLARARVPRGPHVRRGWISSVSDYSPIAQALRGVHRECMSLASLLYYDITHG